MSCSDKKCKECKLKNPNKTLCKILDKTGKEKDLNYMCFLNWKMQHNAFDEVMPEMESCVETFEYPTREGKIVKCRTFLIKCKVRTKSKILNFLFFDRISLYRKYRIYEFAEPIGTKQKLFVIIPVNDKKLDINLSNIESQIY